jgi:hypothetical protein
VERATKAKAKAKVRPGSRRRILKTSVTDSLKKENAIREIAVITATIPKRLPLTESSGDSLRAVSMLSSLGKEEEEKEKEKEDLRAGRAVAEVFRAAVGVTLEEGTIREAVVFEEKARAAGKASPDLDHLLQIVPEIDLRVLREKSTFCAVTLKTAPNARTVINVFILIRRKTSMMMVRNTETMLLGSK